VAPVQREHRPSDLAIHEGRARGQQHRQQTRRACRSEAGHKGLDTAKLELNNDMEHQRLDLAEKSVHRPGRAELVWVHATSVRLRSRTRLVRFVLKLGRWTPRNNDPSCESETQGHQLIDPTLTLVRHQRASA
jgi:hypothetical protein